MTKMEKIASVHLYIEKEIHKVNVTNMDTAEDLCIYLAKHIKITPVTRHLFALRLHKNQQVWLSPNTKLANDKYLEFDFRLRFRIATLKHLSEIDINSFNYLFHQCKTDLLEKKIPEIHNDRHRRDLLGLGVTDMYRHMLEEQVPIETVMNDYKKFIPSDIVKQHLFYIKKPIKESLKKLQSSNQSDPNFVKSGYIRQFEELAPNYWTEEFAAMIDENGIAYNINLYVNPFHNVYPGIWAVNVEGKKEWKEICTIEDLCYISSERGDGTIQLSRKNGIPTYLKFANTDIMYSFVGLLDGYYRLTCKWTFNLCKDLETPSLLRLRSLKCHGPVGGEFSYAKLEDKRQCKTGCYILRESEFQFDTYYLDVCVAGSLKPRSFKIEKDEDKKFPEKFLFSADDKYYPSIKELIKQYSSLGRLFYLEECIPHSEFDQSPLLICQPKSQASSQTAIKGLELGEPQCINPRAIQLFKADKQLQLDGVCVLYRCNLKLTNNKKTVASLQVLEKEFYDKYLKEFLNLANKWAFLSSSAIVKFYGVTLSNPVSMVLEYLELGPLDFYLKQQQSIMLQEDLVEASTCLAAALWYLEENRMVHGNIRCHKLFVASHSENTFSIKLADPGLHQYSDEDIHWLPIECYNNPRNAAASVAADVWAFGTTIWEIFSYGHQPPKIKNAVRVRESYLEGIRLPIPKDCPINIYKIMLDTWELDVHRRKNPQAIMRDINEINYKVYNSRRHHSYATISSRAKVLANRSISTSSLKSVSSTDTSNLGGIDELSEDIIDFDNSRPPYVQSPRDSYCTDINNFNDTCSDSMRFESSFNCVYELDGQYDVVQEDPIGQGFFGCVYRGRMEEKNHGNIVKTVAIKKLKQDAISSCEIDFEREIKIMKSLDHPNIVKIIGVLRAREIGIVMEYFELGSLKTYLQLHQETLKLNHLLNFALDVAQGIEYLHSKNIVHRDLAARNMLVASDKSIKVSDFGLAQVLDTNNYYILKTVRELPIKWYAPECLRDGKFSFYSDVWSYGVTLFEMFSLGEEPKLGNWSPEEETQHLLSALERGERLSCPHRCPQEYYVDLLKPCWHIDRHQRPNFAELVLRIQEFIAASKGI